MKLGSCAFERSKENENQAPPSALIDFKAENLRNDNYKGSKRDFTELLPSF